MRLTLQAFARIYEASAPARKGATRDYTLDYEKFLRSAGLADGDEREIAEAELNAAEAHSRGKFRIDRHRRTRQAERLRLCHDGGESWLYEQLGRPTPDSKRHGLAQSFLDLALLPAPPRWREAWNGYFTQLSGLARTGSSLQPFSREDEDGNLALAHALLGILKWQGPALIRYASSAICGDSKKLQALEPRLKVALTAITGSGALEDFGILRKPRSVTFQGPLALHRGEIPIDFSGLPGPVTLCETNLSSETRLSTTAPLCLTVENEDTFHELAATNPGVLLLLTSYAGSAVRRMIRLLPETLRFIHFGDLDPAGLDIVRDLQEKTGRDIHLLTVPLEASPTRPATDPEIRLLQRLLESDLSPVLRAQAERLLKDGIPENFEQESIPIETIWEVVRKEH